MDRSDAVAIVTGGSSGLGAETALRLARGGYTVLSCDVRAPTADTVPRAVRSIVCDVADAGALEAVFDEAVAIGPLRVVVSCAGRLRSELIYDEEEDRPHSAEIFADLIRTNVVGTFNTLRHAARAMCRHAARPDGERGVVVLTGSIAGEDGQIGQLAYAAGKAAIAGMTLPAARELSRYGIRVVTIAPGMFETAMVEAMADPVVRSLKRQIVHPPRMGRTDEFTSLVEEIVRNRYLNGTTLRLDAATRLGCG